MNIDTIYAEEVAQAVANQATVTITGAIGDYWMTGEQALTVEMEGPYPKGDFSGSGGSNADAKLGLRIPCRLMFDTDMILVDRSDCGTAQAPPQGDTAAFKPEKFAGATWIDSDASRMRIDAAALNALAERYDLSGMDMSQDVEVTMEVGRPCGRVGFGAQATCPNYVTTTLGEFELYRAPTAFDVPVVRVPVAKLVTNTGPDWLVVDWSAEDRSGNEVFDLRGYRWDLFSIYDAWVYSGSGGHSGYSFTVAANTYRGGDGSGNGTLLKTARETVTVPAGHNDDYGFVVYIDSGNSYAISIEAASR